MLVSRNYKFSTKVFILLTLFLIMSSYPFNKTLAELSNFCDDLPRNAYSDLQKNEISTEWFEVYQVEPDVWAIYEPFQWQEVISYLIIGSDSALLFDTGNGLDNIKTIVEQLTDKPIRVLNSHSHFDHIGGNYLFKQILSPATKFSIANSKGNASKQIKMEASAAAICKGLPEGVTKQNHAIKPYIITSTVKDGDIIDLGNRKLEILLIPGHTDDSIALFEKESGLLWTGDSFYEGPIWLFFPETDLEAYKKSLSRLVGLVPQLKALLPAHNTPKADPIMLIETQKALELIFQGKAKAKPVVDFEGVVAFDFKGFGFLMREDYTSPADN